MRQLVQAIAFAATVLASGAAGAQEIEVTIQGAVRRPGTYAAAPGERLSSLIERAGGFADNAWLRGAALFRESARAQNARLLRDLVVRIERELQARPGQDELRREYLATISRLAPSNRVPLRLAHPRLLKETPGDLPLEGGDTLVVPWRTDLVAVEGAVRTPGELVPHAPGSDPGYYVEKAGGFAPGADRRRIYLLKPDGAPIALTREWIRWNPEESRWELSAFREKPPGPEPGDMIVVPKLPSDGSWARGIEELPPLLMQLHALTGVRVDPP